jgi:hypothetical protein
MDGPGRLFDLTSLARNSITHIWMKKPGSSLPGFNFLAKWARSGMIIPL